MVRRHSKMAKVEEAKREAARSRESYEQIKQHLGPEARKLLEQYEGAGQLTPDGGYGITEDEFDARSKEFGEHDRWGIRYAASSLKVEREAKEELEEVLDLPDDPTPEEDRPRIRAKAEQLAEKHGLNAEQTEALVAAYPDWEERQPPDVVEEEDEWHEWRDGFGNPESSPQAQSLEEIEEVPVGAVLTKMPPDQIPEDSAIAVPDYDTGHIRFIHRTKMTEADWNAVRVGMLNQPTRSETWARLGRWLERKIEIDPDLGENATLGEALDSEVEESADSPASLSEARRKR